ncbi:DapH/DapD/GlmU-related protein [Dongia soli]|uniref:DapH/DapD/GlmU-related protein n=1 Tax=Dongia soli TaxID=600628 RepID=A0ABU5E897_9PROT|nr:DapH/DapD/GlmU-related protein [Dongia soli]MDY0882526.1 DapH/DapD/GlmU-related protein [Dongia soli]
MPIDTFVSGASVSPLAPYLDQEPWQAVHNILDILGELIVAMEKLDYRRDGGIVFHRSARIESGITVKPPAIIGPDCFIAAGAYLRDGVWLQDHCVIGPGSEVKSSFLFSGSALAHFNFLADSILGAGVNIEAGAIIANHRNERADKDIRVHYREAIIPTGVHKFGALVGDRARIGANAVIAPGALIDPGQVIGRLTLLDQDSGPK